MNSNIEKIRILDEEWDCLIVLDSCRYDYFEKVYPPYLSGELRKVNSLDSCTSEWFRNNFEGMDCKDIVYISANPRINSGGVSSIGDIGAQKYFYKVVDAWKEGLNNESSVLSPSDMVKYVKRARSKHPEKRLVSHFLQPHFPYLFLGGSKRQRSIEEWGELAREKIINFFKDTRTRKIKDILEVDGVEKFAKKYGDLQLCLSYEKTLIATLERIKGLVENRRGGLVITSDHGEFLGEGKKYGHYEGSENPILREVPWFKV